MNKTQAIFATLTARYGRPQPKDGQEFQAIAQSYEAALGAYSLPDLAAACSGWMNSTKYPRWPEPAELLENLRSFGARPEAREKYAPAHIAHAQGDAAQWYNMQITRPLPHGAWPLNWSDAISHVIGVGKIENRGKSFGWMLTNAWLKGALPTGFDAKAEEFFADANRRKELYLSAVRSRGALKVHEGRTKVVN